MHTNFSNKAQKVNDQMSAHRRECVGSTISRSRILIVRNFLGAKQFMDTYMVMVVREKCVLEQSVRQGGRDCSACLILEMHGRL